MATKASNKVRIRAPKKTLAELCRRYQVQKLALFGSVLSSNFRKDTQASWWLSRTTQVSMFDVLDK